MGKEEIRAPLKTPAWEAMNKDVITCSSISLKDGRNIPKQKDMSSVETYDQKQVFDSFFDGVFFA